MVLQNPKLVQNCHTTNKDYDNTRVSLSYMNGFLFKIAGSYITDMNVTIIEHIRLDRVVVVTLCPSHNSVLHVCLKAIRGVTERASVTLH